MNKKPKNLPTGNLTDQHLFQQAVEGVIPLKAPVTTDSKAPRQRLVVNSDNPAKHFVEDDSDDPLQADRPGSTETDSTHRKNGVKRQTLQKLIRGQFPLEDQFDLHHLNTHSGRIELLKFIAWSQQQGLRRIRVIHGKGLHSKQGPKLKLMTRQVLREHAMVMAFTSCKPAEGGEGATDVLLKS